jgi:hypothetical protein
MKKILKKDMMKAAERHTGEAIDMLASHQVNVVKKIAALQKQWAEMQQLKITLIIMEQHAKREG